MSHDKTTPKVGTILSGPAPRDAIHVAVMPMIAVRDMVPGERLANGIVDPFLPRMVSAGQWFYLFLFPNTITSLTHDWEHPAFPREPKLPEKGRSEADVWEEMRP
jgi:hypothetical protein